MGWGAATLLSVTPAAVGQEGPEPPDESTRQFTSPLQPGDAVRLRFWRERDLDGEFPVDETGVAVLPILGQTQIAGRPPTELKLQIVEAYDEQLRNQDVQVVLLRRVSVIGAVGSPGLYFVDPTMTLGDALALAGGVVEGQGRPEGTRLVRDGRRISSEVPETFYLNELRSGDQIYVPERSWLSRNSTTVAVSLVSTATIVLTALFIN